MHDHKIDRVINTDGKALDSKELVHLDKQTKVMMKDNQYTLLVSVSEERYVAIDRGTVRNIQIGEPLTLKSLACNDFRADVEEEQIDDNGRTCYNCTYRRWEMKGMSCSL